MTATCHPSRLADASALLPAAEITADPRFVLTNQAHIRENGLSRFVDLDKPLPIAPKRERTRRAK